MELKTRDVSPTIATTTVASEAQQETGAVVATTRPVPIKGKRRNLGRQARKRRKKYLEIEAAASAFVAAATAATLETNPSETTLPNEAESACDRINPEDANTTTVLPTDRGYVLDGVKDQTVLSTKDRRDLIRQLGYLPGNALRVVARIEDAFSSEDMEKLFASAASKPTTQDDSTNSTENNGDNNENSKIRSERMASMIQNMMKEPLVIKLYPLALRDESSSTKRRRKRRREEDSSDPQHSSTATTEKPIVSESSTPLMEPFPTIYWVTHPLMKALISKLELDRLNVQFEERLANEAPPLESMKKAHKSYGKERRDLLSPDDRDYVKGRRWYGDDSNADSSPLESPNTTSIPPFSELCGVAGIRNPKGVKCLHAHAAHYWSGDKDNLVGQWVSERLKSGRAFFQGSIEDQTDATNDSTPK